MEYDTDIEQAGKVVDQFLNTYTKLKEVQQVEHRRIESILNDLERFNTINKSDIPEFVAEVRKLLEEKNNGRKKNKIQNRTAIIRNDDGSFDINLKLSESEFQELAHIIRDASSVSRNCKGDDISAIFLDLEKKIEQKL